VTPLNLIIEHTNAKQNGYEATTEIRALETSSRTPIIAVTAGILAGEKINVLNQEWMIILSQL
jgi:CheY-like chemotaxis protein